MLQKTYSENGERIGVPIAVDDNSQLNDELTNSTTRDRF